VGIVHGGAAASAASLVEVMIIALPLAAVGDL
jgi:hypothetical protein